VIKGHGGIFFGKDAPENVKTAGETLAVPIPDKEVADELNAEDNPKEEES
jgi:hypothetical protein